MAQDVMFAHVLKDLMEERYRKIALNWLSRFISHPQRYLSTCVGELCRTWMYLSIWRMF